MYLPTPNRLSDWEVRDLVRHAAAMPPGPGGSAMLDLPPALREEYHIALWPIVGRGWSTCRFVGLWPGQQIPLHRDSPITGVRHHIPLALNRYCVQVTENEAGVLICQHLEVGRVYTMDPTQPHGAVNWGETIRLHLVIDVEGER